MTHDDLATLLRDDVVSSEPTHGLDSMVPVRLGRRRLRTRRLVSGAAAAVVVAVGAAVAVPLALSDDTADPSRGIDPASQEALDNYDAQQMPGLMDDHVRPVLERSVPDLGPVTFRAGDGQGDELSPDLYDKASGMSVTYGALAHTFSADIFHAASEAEGDHEKYCRTGLRRGEFLECTVEVLEDGTVVIARLWALQPIGEVSVGGGETVPSWGVVLEKHLGDVNPGDLYFQRGVKVIKSRSLITLADERVQAPSLQAARTLFRVPTEDLAEIGTDPVLVMPEPPTDDSDCGPWTLDPGVSYSC